MRVLFVLFASLWTLFAAGDRFTGKWASSQNDADGTIDIQLSDSAQVTFTFQGQDVKTKVLSLKREEGKFEVRYLFDLGGTKLISTINGTVSGEKVDGKYRTTTAEGDGDVDGGTFTGSAK